VRNDNQLATLGHNLGHFTLGVRTKETQELSNPIGGEIKIGPKGFTLGVKTKVCTKLSQQEAIHLDGAMQWAPTLHH
jgi:hypothetical protein